MQTVKAWPIGITGLWQPSVHSDVAFDPSMSALPCGSQAFIAMLLSDPSMSALPCGSQAFIATLLSDPSMSSVHSDIAF
jgi:hypothetical protein